MKKKFALVLGCFYLVVGLGGCGSTSDKEVSDAQQSRLVKETYEDKDMGFTITKQYNYEEMKMSAEAVYDGKVINSATGVFETNSQGRITYEEVGSYIAHSGGDVSGVEIEFYAKSSEYYGNGVLKKYEADGCEVLFDKYGFLERTTISYEGLEGACLYEYENRYDLYDKNGNPTKVDVVCSMSKKNQQTDKWKETGSESYSINFSLNEKGLLLKTPDTTRTYDANGNLIYVSETVGNAGERITTYIYE